MLLQCVQGLKSLVIGLIPYATAAGIPCEKRNGDKNVRFSLIYKQNYFSEEVEFVF